MIVTLRFTRWAKETKEKTKMAMVMPRAKKRVFLPTNLALSVSTSPSSTLLKERSTTTLLSLAMLATPARSVA